MKSEKKVFDLSSESKVPYVSVLLHILIPCNLARGQRPSLRGRLVVKISDMKSEKKVFDLSSDSKVPYVCVILPIFIPCNLARGQRPSLRGHLVIRISDMESEKKVFVLSSKSKVPYVCAFTHPHSVQFSESSKTFASGASRIKDL